MTSDTTTAAPFGEAAPLFRRSRPRRFQRVLLVGGALGRRETYAERLRFAGFDVHVARDGLEGLARAVALRPDIIVTDLAAPGLDSVDLARRLQVAAATRVIPVIALTESDRLERGSRETGGVRFLRRSCGPEELAAEVDRHVQARRPRPRRRGRSGRP
jgi:CheY-like chemotaxis protein